MVQYFVLGSIFRQSTNVNSIIGWGYSTLCGKSLTTYVFFVHEPFQSKISADSRSKTDIMATIADFLSVGIESAFPIQGNTGSSASVFST